MASFISVINITMLVIQNAKQVSANGINDRGQIVGQFVDAQGSQHGFICQEGSFCQIDYPGATATLILDINNLGQITGMFTSLVATSGFLFDRGTFSPPMTYPGAGNLTINNGLNDRGEIVGVYQDANVGEHSFIYKAGKYADLLYPGAKETGAQAINNSGQVVGSFPDANGTHGFVYLENVGVFTPALNCQAATSTVLRAINNGGQIVGGCFDPQGNEHPFLYTAGAINPITIPGATSASILGINDRAQIVGNMHSAAGAGSFVGVIFP